MYQARRAVLRSNETGFRWGLAEFRYWQFGIVARGVTFCGSAGTEQRA
jgi:hypothetical protein